MDAAVLDDVAIVIELDVGAGPHAGLADGAVFAQKIEFDGQPCYLGRDLVGHGDGETVPVDFLLTAVLGGLQSLAGSAVGNVPYVERDGRLRLVGQFQRAADYLLRPDGLNSPNTIQSIASPLRLPARLV